MPANGPELGGTRAPEINLNDLNVNRAVHSSVFIEAVGMPANGMSTCESGQLVNLSASDRAALGLSSDDQIVVTTAHGLTGRLPERIKVTGSNNQVYGAEIVKLDDALDLALLKVDGLAPGTLPSVTIVDSGAQQSAVSDFIYSVGHAGTNGLNDSVKIQGGSYLGSSSIASELGRVDTFNAQNSQVTHYEQDAENVISSLTQPEQAEALFYFNQPLIEANTLGQRGESGGGLFNPSGQLIGIMDWSQLASGGGFVPHDLYVPATDIETLVNELPKFHLVSQTSGDNAYPEDFISRTNGNPSPLFNPDILSTGSDE